MSYSAFGVEHGYEISKAAKKKQTKKQPASVGRLVAGGLFPGFHAAAAGKPGHKLPAAGWELGGNFVAPGVGGAVGTHIAHERGHYYPQRRR